VSEKCNYDPMQMAGLPIGMFHCPECGEMVIAGMPHPDYSILDEDFPTLAAQWKTFLAVHSAGCLTHNPTVDR